MTVAERIGEDTIRFERSLPAPRETVWRWLTDPDLRRQWFMGGPIDGRVGGSIGMTVDHDNLSAGAVPYPERYAGMKGVSFTETITAWDPPRTLAFSWDGGKEGEVTFELHDEGDETRLVLTHRRISGPAPMANFGGGWTSHLAVLKAKLDGRAIDNFWTLHAESEAAIRDALGA